MSKYTVADRLNQIMVEHEMKQVDILRLCAPYCDKYGVKLTKSALNHYVTGKVSPRQDKLEILSMALGVNEAWLLGFDVPMQRKSPTPEMVKDGRRARLIELYDKLSEEDQTEIIALIEWKLSRQ